MNLYRLLLKDFRNNLKRYTMFMLTCLIAMIGLFTALSLRNVAINMEMNDDMLSMINISCFLIVIISVVFIRYAIICYIKIRTNDYEIYSILGMPIKVKRKIILLEFMGMSFFVMFIGELIGSILILLFREICSKFIYASVDYYFSIQVYILTMLLFIVSLVISISLDRIEKKKKAKNHKKMKRNKVIAGYISLVTGCILIFTSFALIINFSVGNMILAVIMNPLGLSFVFIFVLNIIIPFVKSKENIYYKKLILLSDLFDNMHYKLLVAFAVYTSNFLLLYILGSLFVGMTDSDVPYDKYFKYDVVIQSGSDRLLRDMKNTEDSFYCKYKLCDVVGRQSYDNAKIIRNSSYNHIMKKEMKLSNHDVYIFAQRFEEDFLPVAIGKDAIHMEGKRYSINIINAGWEYLYSCLDSPDHIFIVVSDEFYRELQGSEGIFLFMNHVSIPDDIQDTVSGKNEMIIYDKEKLIGKMKLENLFVFFIFFSISFILLLDGSFIIYVKMFSEIPEKKLKFELLELIGMKRNEIEKIFRKNYKIMIDAPIYLSFLVGLLLGICNIMADSGFSIYYVMEYALFLTLLVITEILYAFFLRKKIRKEIL